MGRRTLRKINPSLDLSGHLKTIEQLPHPWDSTALFGRTAPIEIEVGSGKGLFIRNAAAARPDTDFLGIEVVRKYAEFAAAGLAKDDASNAIMMHGDGLRVFKELIPDDSLAAVHVYFPDPWWKKRHRRRRVMQEPFLKDVQRTLAPGGLLHFWTDVEEYFQTALEQIAAHTTMVGPLPVDELPAEHDMDYRTHFERRVRKADEPVYRAEFQKSR